MTHFMPENIRGEIGRRTLKFKIERIDSQSVDFRFIAERIIRKELHVRPKDGRPFTRAALHDEADIIDHAVTIAVQCDIGLQTSASLHHMS